MKFGNQIVEMLQHISYIDECDTLGQKADDKDIHRVMNPWVAQSSWKYFLTVVGAGCGIQEDLGILQSCVRHSYQERSKIDHENGHGE